MRRRGEETGLGNVFTVARISHVTASLSAGFDRENEWKRKRDLFCFFKGSPNSSAGGKYRGVKNYNIIIIIILLLLSRYLHEKVVWPTNPCGETRTMGTAATRVLYNILHTASESDAMTGVRM